MKLLQYGALLMVGFIMSFVLLTNDTYAESNGTNLGISEIIELLISLDIIPEDKADKAREIIEEKGITKSDTMAKCLKVTRNLYVGVEDSMTDGEVSKLQEYLMETGDFTYPKITGYFGPATEEAVQRWQARQGVVKSGNPDTTGYGLVGPKTRAKMACKVAKKVEKEVKKEKKEEKKEEKKKKYDDDDEESTLTEIEITVNEDKSKVYWDADGISPKGYKIVWSLEEGPEYPTRNGDKYYHSLTEGDGSRTLRAFDGSGDYYVRVCEYTGSGCDLYSNEESLYLTDEDEDKDDDEEDDTDDEEGEVEEIELHADQDNEKVWWETEGESDNGFKVVWSLNEDPEYPLRDGDTYKYLSSPDADHAELEAIDGEEGTYYVRVCEYLGGSCGEYSNEVTLEL